MLELSIQIRRSSREAADPADEGPGVVPQQRLVDQGAMDQERPPQRPPLLHRTSKWPRRWTRARWTRARWTRSKSGLLLRATGGQAPQGKTPQHPGSAPLVGPTPSTRVMDPSVPQTHGENQGHSSKPTELWIAMVVAMVMAMAMVVALVLVLAWRSCIILPCLLLSCIWLGLTCLVVMYLSCGVLSCRAIPCIVLYCIGSCNSTPGSKNDLSCLFLS